MARLKRQLNQSQRVKAPGNSGVKQSVAAARVGAGANPKLSSNSEQHFQLLFKTMLQGVVYQDAAGRVLAMNPAAKRILGKTETEFLGKTSMDVERHTLREDGSRFPGIKHPSMVALQTGREVRDVVMGVYNPKLKSYRWINVCAVPLFHSGEAKPYQVYTIFDDITEQRKNAAALYESEVALKLAQRLAGVGSWEWNIRNGRHSWSEEVFRIYHRSPALAPVVYPEVKQYYTAESWNRLAAAVEKCRTTGTPYECDVEMVFPDGSRRWITARGEAVREATGRIVQLRGTVQDITERKRAEALIQRANQTLQAIRACHEEMLRAQTESELLNAICRIIVETGGERMAWVGYAMRNHTKAVRPVAGAGFSKTYVNKAQVTWANTPRGRGPVGSAIRTGKICICHNTRTDPDFAPWRDFARRCGYGSVIALPLKMEKDCFGALCIYARQPDAFDTGEQMLLADLANDLSFGITTLRLHAERKRLENEVLQSIEQEQERIGRDLHDGLCQVLVGAKYRSAYLEKILDGNFSKATQEARELEQILNQAIEQTRDLARGLNPVKAAPSGLELALQRLANDVQAQTGKGPRCFCYFPKRVKIPDHKLANHLYRIAQEAVQNAIKHARARNISVTLDRQRREIRLVVKDDGRGIPAKLKKTGMGLDNMHARATLIGGNLEIRRRKLGGTAVTCCVVAPVNGESL